MGDEKYIARLAQNAPVQSLSPQELELDYQPVTKNPRPEIVRAWVRFGPEPFRVNFAEADVDQLGCRDPIHGVQRRVPLLGLVERGLSSEG